MRLRFLGTGGYHPNARRHTACILLPESGVVFDAGTSFFRLAEHLETDTVHIFLTHAHLDHVAGLTFFLVPLIFGKVRRAQVSSGEKYLQGVREHLFSESIFPVLPTYEFSVLPPETLLPCGGVLRHCPLKHPGGSIGYRIDWPGKSMAYITDTTVDGTYHDFVRGVDLLIHECYFPDSAAEWAAKTGHSHTSMVTQLARDAGVGRLMLVHIDPQRPDDDPIDIAVARSIFPNTEVAEDLQEINW